MPGRGDDELDEDVEDAATVQMGQGELSELMKGLKTPEPTGRAQPAAAPEPPKRPTPRLRPDLDGDDRPSQLPESQRVRVGEAGQRQPETRRSPLLLIVAVIALLTMLLAAVYVFTQMI